MQHAAAGAPLVVFDIPLLYETHAEQQLDLVLVVSAPADAQQQRVLARPGMTPEKLAAILARQVRGNKPCACGAHQPAQVVCHLPVEAPVQRAGHIVSRLLASRSPSFATLYTTVHVMLQQQLQTPEPVTACRVQYRPFGAASRCQTKRSSGELIT